MLNGKFYLLLAFSFLLYSLYINYAYAKLDQSPYRVYVYNPAGVQIRVSEYIVPVENWEALSAGIAADKSGIAVDLSEENTTVILYESGNTKVDHFRGEYALSILASQSDHSPIQFLSSQSLETKRRLEMVCEMVFFEIVVIGFLGIAALFFKEKQMGVLRVFGVSPGIHSFFVLSKIFVFLLLDLTFVLLLSLVNLGWTPMAPVLPSILTQVMILSPIMVLVGFLFSLLFESFKQFGFAYTFIVILMTAPIFLAANTSLEWAWLEFYPVYYLYMGLKNAYFGGGFTSPLYYAVSLFTMVLIFTVALKMMNQELAKE